MRVLTCVAVIAGTVLYEAINGETGRHAHKLLVGVEKLAGYPFPPILTRDGKRSRRLSGAIGGVGKYLLYTPGKAFRIAGASHAVSLLA